MELLLRDGDYVPDGSGSLIKLTGPEEVLQRVLFRLTVRRGSFPLLPELGSELYRLGGEKPSARQALAAQYVAQALAEEPEVEVETVRTPPRPSWPSSPRRSWARSRCPVR